MNDIELKPVYKTAYLHDLCVWRNDKRVRPYLRTTLDNYDENQCAWVDWVAKRTDCAYYFILRNNVVLGYCALEDIHWQNRSAEISLLVNPDEAGKGIGKQAVSLLLSIAFNRLGLNLVWGEVYENNPAVDFWTRIRFSLEGKLRQRKYIDGEYHSSIMFSMTEKEYYEMEESK